MERVRFGTFDFLPSTGELTRGGVPVKLQAQPARVLAALVGRPGQIVTRETLQREVWGDGTHVDFERGLNFCVAQVRSALGDSADAPRYIETVPKQGYRFVAPVAPVVAVVPADSPAPDAAVAPAEPHPQIARSRPLPGRLVAGAALALMLGLLGWSLAARFAAPRPTIAVVPFYNETGRDDLAILAASIGDAAVASLAAPERTAAFSVIGNAPSLRHPFGRDDVQRVASELGAGWVLIGQLKSDGQGLRVIAHLIRVSDMKHLWARTYDDPAFSLEAQARTAEAIAEAVAASLSTGA